MKTLFLLMFISSNAFAEPDFPIRLFGDQVGNGGKLVVCRDRDDIITSTKLLDFYESRILYLLEPDFDGNSYLDKAASAATRLSDFEPRRASQYRDQIETFLQNTRFVSSPLIETPDSDHIVAPPIGCAIEQVAIQLKPSFPEDRLFTISQTLWEAMSENDKAGLVLHEVIYFDAIARGHKNSIAVRYLNAYLSSGKISDLNLSEYLDIMHAARMRTERVNDPHLNFTWTFLDSIEADWDKAKRACRDLEQARLPGTFEIGAAKDLLVHSTIGALIRESDMRESWTSFRRSEDGSVAAGLWTPDNIDFVFRSRSESANILCIQQ